MTEEWRAIDHYPYEVSNLGRVRRIGNVGLIAQNLAPKRHGSYLKVDLWKWGQRKAVRVHRLVAAAFLPPPAPHQHEVNHLDLNPFNNAADNLEWSSRCENEQHKRFMKAFEEEPK